MTDRPPLVLVVDDDEPIRRIVARSLQRDGFRVIDAASGEEALTRVEALQEPLALLITDVVMPGMDGSQLAERLRQQQPRLPVLFMSGQYDAVPGTAGAGPAAFLAKPFRGDMFATAVKALIGGVAGRRPRG